MDELVLACRDLKMWILESDRARESENYSHESVPGVEAGLTQMRTSWGV
jgi:hypothetical protein